MESIAEIIQSLQPEIEGKILIKERWLREGVTIIPNSFLLDKRLSPQAKVIFSVLALHAFNKGHSYPTYELLEKEIGLTKPYLIKYMKELTEIGLIKITRTGRANDYDITFSVLDDRVDDVIKVLKEFKAKQEEKRKKRKE